MMTGTLEVSILSAPLAAIDRRVLSQAWYSALHVARASSQKPARQPKPSRAVLPAAKFPVRDGRQQTQRRGLGEVRGSLAPSKARCSGAVVADRRAAGSPLARKIERAFFTPKAQHKRATLTVEGRRVHVTVSTGHSGVRFIAVCSPSVRDVVARALAQARFALAARCLPCS
jgi:hypothetical protein